MVILFVTQRWEGGKNPFKSAAAPYWESYQVLDMLLRMNDNRADLLTTKLGIDSHGLIDAGTAMDHLYLLPETVVSQWEQTVVEWQDN